MLLKKSKNGTKVIHFRNMDEVNELMKSNENLIIIDQSGKGIEGITDLGEKLGYEIKHFNC